MWTEFDMMALRTLEGQATEAGWQLDDVEGLGPSNYLELIMHKTCWYTTIHPLRVGAIVGSRGAADPGPLVRFGFHFGAAFQIRDDLLNLVGTERTQPLMHLIDKANGADIALMRDYLNRTRADRSPELVGKIRALMDDYGSITFAGEYAEGILLVAEEYFEEAFAGAFYGHWCPTSGPDGAEAHVLMSLVRVTRSRRSRTLSTRRSARRTTPRPTTQGKRLTAPVGVARLVKSHTLDRH